MAVENKVQKNCMSMNKVTKNLELDYQGLHPKVIKCIELLEKNEVSVYKAAYSPFIFKYILRRGIPLKPLFLRSLPNTISLILVPLFVTFYLAKYIFNIKVIEKMFNSPYQACFFVLMIISPVITHYFLISLKVRKKINLHNWKDL